MFSVKVGRGGRVIVNTDTARLATVRAGHIALVMTLDNCAATAFGIRETEGEVFISAGWSS